MCIKSGDGVLCESLTGAYLQKRQQKIENGRRAVIEELNKTAGSLLHGENDINCNHPAIALFNISLHVV